MEKFYLDPRIKLTQDPECFDIIEMQVSFELAEEGGIEADGKDYEFEEVSRAKVYLISNKIDRWFFMDMASGLNAQLTEFANLVYYTDDVTDDYKPDDIKYELCGRVAYLDEISVERPIRNRGIGTKSMHDLLNLLLALGTDYVALRAYPLEFECDSEKTEKSNRLQKFYNAFGFHAINPEDVTPFMVLDTKKYEVVRE